MIRHFTLIAFRSFARFKSTFIINLVGLSTGLTCTLLIYLWVQDELSVDAFHKNGDRLYQVMTNHHNADGIVTMEATPDPLAEALANEVPEIEYAAAATPSSWFGDFILDYGVEKTKARGEFVSNDYFKLFAFSIQLEWWYFLIAGFSALIVAWATVGTQALKPPAPTRLKC